MPDDVSVEPAWVAAPPWSSGGCITLVVSGVVDGVHAIDAGAVTANDSGFREFYAREFDGLVRQAALILGSQAHAADVVHDAFVAAYQRWDMLEDPRRYLYRSVVNGCRDRWRRSERERRLQQRLPREPHPTVRDVLWDVLSRLPMNQRTAVVLRFYGGFTQAEIAEHMDCAHGSVGPWIRRALDQMREALDD